MKTLNTVNVIKSKNGIIENLASFPEKPGGNRFAEDLFCEWAVGIGMSEQDREVALDNGQYDNRGGEEVCLVHSTESLASAVKIPVDETLVPVKIAVACHNASGEVDFFLTTVMANRADYVEGRHADKAIELAKSAGYEAPFLCYDPAEFGNIERMFTELDE